MHPSRRAPTALTALAAGALVAPLALVGAVPASAAPNNNSSAKLQQAVTTQGVLAHLREFQRIADANGGNRAAGSPGYDASAAYVAGKLRGAGYAVELQDFDFPYFEELSDAAFARVSPNPAAYALGTDFATMTYSGAGDVTGAVTAVDVRIPPGPTASGNTSGCEAADFAGFPAGNVALVQRGTCSFGIKAANAAAAGASAVVVFNEGQPGRDGLLQGTLGAPVRIPVVGTTYAVGAALAATPSTVRVTVDAVSEVRTSTNVIAESRTGRADNVVMAGAHLDSVTEGPGTNDNGSGSAAVLETALQMAKVKTGNKVRFAWWSAEELGLVGSTEYVSSLSEEEREDIALYLNFDMVGSPNFFRGVYDGNETTPVAGVTVPEGSAQIEELFNAHFTAKGLPFQDTEFSGRSDYQAFINNGIPAGGLFTGAEGVKTAAEAARYGGVAGAAYDPCYHSACDDLVKDGDDPAVYGQLRDLVGNVNTVALDTNSDAIAHAVITYAYDTAAINGVRNPGKSPGKAKAVPGHQDPGGGGRGPPPPGGAAR